MTNSGAKLRTRIRQAGSFEAATNVAGVELDRALGIARRDGRILRIGSIEFKLLDLLTSKPGVVFSREDLIGALWGKGADINEQTISVKIARLKKALTIGQAPDPIRSVRGQGYRWLESADDDFVRWKNYCPRKLRGSRPPSLEE